MMKFSNSMHRPECWIIAYDHSPRGDDGIGPFVARNLIEAVGPTEKVATCTVQKLDLTMLEQVQGCGHMIFVDTCLREIENGVTWTLVEPELNGWAAGSYHLSPRLFVGLLKLLYDCKPEVWMVSVQGYCYEMGDTMRPETRRAAEQAGQQIVDWLFLNGIALSQRLPENTFKKE